MDPVPGQEPAPLTEPEHVNKVVVLVLLEQEEQASPTFGPVPGHEPAPLTYPVQAADETHDPHLDPTVDPVPGQDPLEADPEHVSKVCVDVLLEHVPQRSPTA